MLELFIKHPEIRPFMWAVLFLGFLACLWLGLPAVLDAVSKMKMK